MLIRHTAHHPNPRPSRPHLREERALADVGLGLEDITAEDWIACPSVGHAAWFLEYAGVLAPAAAGHGRVLTAFESRLDPGQLAVTGSVRLDRRPTNN